MLECRQTENWPKWFNCTMHYKERLKIIRSNLLGFDFGYLSLYYRLFFSPKVGSLQEFLEELAEDIKPFRFLQIGGNDGYANDPIFKLVKKHPWEGIIVEPQDEVFHRKLKRPIAGNEKSSWKILPFQIKPK